MKHDVNEKYVEVGPRGGIKAKVEVIFDFVLNEAAVIRKGGVERRGMMRMKIPEFEKYAEKYLRKACVECKEKPGMVEGEGIGDAYLTGKCKTCFFAREFH